MSSIEDREKHAKRRKRNFLAKELMDRKGPYSIKVIHPKKTKYKREHINVNNFEDFEEE